MSGLAVLALLIVAAAGVVLVAVAASGAGPLRSLRRSIGGLKEVRDEAEQLRRRTEVLRRRAAELRADVPDDPASP